MTKSDPDKNKTFSHKRQIEFMIDEVMGKHIKDKLSLTEQIIVS